MQLEYPQYCQLVATIVGFATFKQSQQLAFNLLAIFCAVTFINEVAATILWNDYHKSTHWLYNIYFPFRCAFILYFFVSAVEQQKVKKVILLLFFITIFFTVLTNYIHKQFTILNAFESYTYFALYVIVCGIYFIDVITNDNTIALLWQPFFYVAIGILIYSLIMVIRYAIWDFLTTIPNYEQLLNITTNIANTILYSFIIASFICTQMLTKSHLQ